MQILDRDTLISRMIQTVRAKTSAITYFGPGPFRAFLFAVATEIQHLYYRMFQVEQRLDPLSASGDALDAWASSRGLTRAGAGPASVILSVSAPATIGGAGTVSITGAAVTGVGTTFTTQAQVNDILIVNGFSYLITAIASDVDATVIAAVDVTAPTGFQIQKSSALIPVAPTPLQVSSSDGATFNATEDLLLEPEFAGSTTLTGKLIALSVGTGTSQNVAAGTISSVVNPSVSPLVTLTVTNDSAAQGATDVETDTAFRSRIAGLFAALNQGTRQFYDAQVRLALPRVVRTYVARGSQLNEVVVYCATRDGSALSSPEKSTIATALMEVTPVQTFVTITDMLFQSIDVSFDTTLTPGTTAAQVTASIARSYAGLLDWSIWPFETSIQADDLLRIASGTDGIDSLTISSFVPATDTSLPAATLPKVGTIAIRDVSTGTTSTVTAMNNQYPRLI